MMEDNIADTTGIGFYKWINSRIRDYYHHHYRQLLLLIIVGSKLFFGSTVHVFFLEMLFAFE